MFIQKKKKQKKEKIKTRKKLKINMNMEYQDQYGIGPVYWLDHSRVWLIEYNQASNSVKA